MTQSKTNPSRFKVMGWVMLATGALLAAMVWSHPDRLRAPAWVAYAAAGAFVFAGCSSLARAWRHERLALGLVCLVLAALTAVAAWIGLGPGARHCIGHAGGLGFLASETACRGAFGTGTLVLGAMAFVAVRQWLGMRSA